MKIKSGQEFESVTYQAPLEGLKIFTRRVGEWAESVFGDSTRCPTAELLKHLTEELGELCRNPSDGDEMADMILILLHQAWREGIDIAARLEAKFELCRTSEWHWAEDSGRMRRIKAVVDRPRVVCLCGSTRFRAQFTQANFEETIKGAVVLSVGFYMHAERIIPEPDVKRALDALHFRKIEMADEILVIDVDKYIGWSTRNEIDHASKLGKIIRYWSNEQEAGPLRKESNV